MAPQARLLIVDRVLPERVEPNPRVAGDLLFDLVMMVWTGGRERTASDLQALLGAADLRLERVISMPTPDGLVEAVPT
jgi:hypothetical protein